MSKDLHIITLNVPYPPDYGGMIDTYYRIQSLFCLGVRIHLHCFEYGRHHPKELESICETISYYPRRSGLLSQLSLIPYIVYSRRSELLLKSLIKNNYPILFDGLHSTYYINHPALMNRKKFVRVHNIEHKYYETRAKNEPDLFRKLYFFIESKKLIRFEKVLGRTDFILPLNASEHDYFNNKFHNSALLAPFHPFNETQNQQGFGNYILYHGDLSVNENAAVSNSLIMNIFSKVPYQCIIAGKNPPRYILENSSLFPNIKVVSDPDSYEMSCLIQNAHIHLLPSLSKNGFKLKLLFALYAGRHCLVNSLVAETTSLGRLCNIADSDEEILKKVHMLMQEEFKDEKIIERQNVLRQEYNNLSNAQKLTDLIFNNKEC